LSVIIQQIDISLKARCRRGKRIKKKKKNLVGVGNKETTKKKRGDESNGIKGIRKSIKRSWRAHLHSYT